MFFFPLYLYVCGFILLRYGFFFITFLFLLSLSLSFIFVLLHCNLFICTHCEKACFPKFNAHVIIEGGTGRGKYDSNLMFFFFNVWQLFLDTILDTIFVNEQRLVGLVKIQIIVQRYIERKLWRDISPEETRHIEEGFIILTQIIRSPN